MLAGSFSRARRARRRSETSQPFCLPPIDGRRRVQAAVARLEEILQSQRYSARTVEAYVSWVRRFLGFRLGRGRNLEDPDAVRVFLSELAIRKRVSASTQNQARSALVFFFRRVMGSSLEALEGVTPASRPPRVPV